MDINSAANNYNNISSVQNQSQSQSSYEVQTSKSSKVTDQDNLAKIIENKKSVKHVVDEKDVIKAIEKANEKLQTTSTEFSFSVHEATKQIMIKVVDKETKKVIQEFPPENVLDMVARAMVEAGLIIDKRL